MLTEQAVLDQAGVLLRKARWLELAASFPWCIKCHRPSVKAELTAKGAQRWQCPLCRIRYGEKDYCERNEKRNLAVRLFNEGLSLRQVCRAVGIVKHTATAYRKLSTRVVCECGRSIDHKGWCWWRLQNSPKRQEFMKRWHSKAA